MGRKIDALLGRNFKTSKFKATVSLAVSRLSILKNQRHARLSIARSDLLQLLNLGHHERALLRVDQVIKEQNMLDVFEMINGYCLLLIERVNLIEQEKVCPDELNEAASSLLYASARCGELPELQEIRVVLTTRFGKEFAARAIELRNNCGVNHKMIQKLSTRQSSLESRLKVLKELASENGIVLQIEEPIPVTKEENAGSDPTQNHTKTEAKVNKGGTEIEDGAPGFTKEVEEIVSFSELLKGRKYRDAADAAQAAFESAAYAAAAARAAVELSRSESFDPNDQGSSNSPKKTYNTCVHVKPKELTEESRFRKMHPKTDDSESEEEEIHKGNKAEQKTNAARGIRSLSGSSSDSDGNLVERTLPTSDAEGLKEKEMVFDASDSENGSEQHEIKLPRNHTLDLGPKLSNSEKAKTVKDGDMFGSSGAKIISPYQKPIISVRTRKVYGP